MRNLLGRLAEMRAGEVPVLSVYVDLQPYSDGSNSASRPGLEVVKERLRRLESVPGQHRRARASLRFDIARIHRYLDRGVRPSTQGAAIFACADRGLFEVVDVDVPFATTVVLGRRPDVAQLARLEAWGMPAEPLASVAR